MKIIGHRGARGLTPENTLASIETAIKHGVDEVEIDVRVTRDSVAILHHDTHVTDPDGTELSIADSTYAELLRHKADLAALDYAVRAIAHRCRLMIEIKPGVPVQPVIAIIRDRLNRGWRLAEFVVASYDYHVLEAVRDKLPGVELVVIEDWSGVRAGHRARKLGTKRISMNARWLWSGYLSAVKKAGYQITPFTVNNPKLVYRWHPYLYGVITDRPDLFEKKK